MDKSIEDALQTNDAASKALLSKPLLGIPFAGKDSGAIKGLRFASGIPARKDIRADVDSTLVTMLRNAGGIPICMTNVPECLLFWDTANKSFGRTHNPYNKNAIPGGSSGGVCSAISSGASLIGIGSDIGGSIRIPSYFCGVYGHCCSCETVPLDHHWPPYAESRKKMVSYGPITRYVQDIRPLLKIYTSQSNDKLNFDHPFDLKKLKVYYLLELDDESLTKTDEELKHGILRVVDKLRSEVAEVREAKLKYLNSAFKLWMFKMKADDANKLSFEMNNREGHLNVYLEFLRYFINCSQHTFASITTAIFQDLSASSLVQNSVELKKQYDALYKEVHDILDDNSVLIMPTYPEVEVKPPGCFLKFKNTCYTGVFNTLRVSMTQAPIGLSKKGLPMGIQIIGEYVLEVVIHPTNGCLLSNIGKHLNDNVTLSVAEYLDAAGYAGWVPPTKVNAWGKSSSTIATATPAGTATISTTRANIARLKVNKV